MYSYVFVCIGTDKLIEDSFGPRVGDILIQNLQKYSNIEVLGTMKEPVHFENAPVFLEYLKQRKSELILIDSALGKKELIGNTYINVGGIELGKAFGKSLFFPASLNIKTVVGSKDTSGNFKEEYIEYLAQKLANQITKSICNVI